MSHPEMPQLDTSSPNTPSPKAHIWVPVSKEQEQSTVPDPCVTWSCTGWRAAAIARRGPERKLAESTLLTSLRRSSDSAGSMFHQSVLTKPKPLEHITKNLKTLITIKL